MKKHILITLGAAAIIVITGMIYVFADEQTQQIHLSPAGTEGLIPSEVSDANIGALLKKLEDSGQIPKLDRSDSLGGPDANGDGIRDDIEALIVSLKRSSEETKALRQLAKASQVGITGNIRTREAAKKYADDVGKGIDCVFSQFGEQQGSQYSTIISLSMKNTRLRKIEEHRVDGLLSGMTFSTFGATACE